jgi:hypothetical protein
MLLHCKYNDRELFYSFHSSPHFPTFTSLPRFSPFPPSSPTPHTSPFRYGNISATSADIASALDKCNLLETIEKLPKGLQTSVGERGARLSGGERQKVSIARYARMCIVTGSILCFLILFSVFFTLPTFYRYVIYLPSFSLHLLSFYFDPSSIYLIPSFSLYPPYSALLKNPTLILCDEVTSSVDAFAERDIVDTLRRASEQRTTLTGRCSASLLSSIYVH